MTAFSEQLHFWRKSKGFSQLSLALATDVSSKHISHMENGRSKPSRAMVLCLSEVLDTPLSTRNEWLNLLGFADHYVRTPLEQCDMHRLNKTLNVILEKQEPYPAIVLDWHWNIIMKNNGFDRLLSQCSDVSQSTNIARLVFSDNGLKPLLSNWDEVAYTTLLRLKKGNYSAPLSHI